MIATDPEPAEKLAREAGLNEEECLEDYGPFQMLSLIHIWGSTRWGWPALALATLAAAYTHYFACVSVGCVCLFLMIGLLIQKKARAIPVLIGCGLIALVGYLPWLPSLVGQLTSCLLYTSRGV